MSNSGAWSGDHYEQLEEMYETIVKSEKLSGRNISSKDEIEIRAEIADAYDGVIRCFEKENADPSIITYAINLMKSTVATTNDLRNLSQLAIVISESTIGALYLVNELQEQERNKNGHETEVNENEESFKENITEKIDFTLSSDVLEALCSEKNEQAYEQLNRRAMAGDKDAIIAVDLIRKSIHYMQNDVAGNVKGKGREVAALALVDKLVTTGEEATFTIAEQLIKVFDLGKYDIYNQDENGQNVISIDKVREEFKKRAEAIHLTLKPEIVQGLSQEYQDIDIISERYNENSINNSSMGQMVSDIKKSSDRTIFWRSAMNLSKNGDTQNLGVLVENNIELSQNVVMDRLNYANRYGVFMKKSGGFYSTIEAIASTRKTLMNSIIKADRITVETLDNTKNYRQISSDKKTNDANNKVTPDDWEIGN